MTALKGFVSMPPGLKGEDDDGEAEPFRCFWPLVKGDVGGFSIDESTEVLFCLLFSLLQLLLFPVVKGPNLTGDDINTTFDDLVR